MMTTVHLLIRLLGPVIVTVYLFKYSMIAGALFLLFRRALRGMPTARAFLWVLLAAFASLDALIIAGVVIDPIFPM